LPGHETKYALPAALLPVARQLLAAHARPELPHAAGVVESIYFDTPALASYEEKRASELRKLKVRLRWYDGGGAVWIEAKERLGSARLKRRAVSGLDGGELGRLGLAGAAGLDSARLARELGEPVPAGLRPVAHLRYRRERWVATDGTRLNLDREIETLAVAPWLAAGSPPPGPGAAAVLEVKGGGRELPPWLEPLGAFGCRRGSFSKYAAALAACGI